MKQTGINPRAPVFNFPSIIIGTLTAFLFTITGGLLLGAVYHFSSLSEGTLPTGGTLVLFFSVICGGAVAGRRAGIKGIYHGAGTGVLFFIISWLIAASFLPGELEMKNTLLKMLLILPGGALGGILGLGLRKS